MLFDESIDDHKILEEWVKEIGVKYHEGLIIKKTENKGIGVFFKSDKANDPVDPTDSNNVKNPKVELLRCPRKSVFNMYTLREIVSKMNDEGKNIVKRVISIVFRNCGPSESNIIIAHFISFKICLNKMINVGIGTGLERYVKILLNTKVGSPYTDQRDALEDFVSDFKGNILMKSLVNEINIWENIIEELKDEELLIELNDVLQLCAAVRSRVLEIPRGEENDNDDYYVDVTLVPIIDFVNHDGGENNAFFDIDKQTNDVILYGENIENGKEILIKYDEVEDLHRMFMNYGFLPRDDKISKIIEIPILGYNLKENDDEIDNVTISSRLLISGQSPNVQFLIKFNESGDINKCEIIGNENYSWIVFFTEGEIKWDEWEDEDEDEDEARNNNNSNNNYNSITNGEEVEEYELFARKFERCRLTIAGIEAESITNVEQARGKFKGYVSRFMTLFWKRAEIGREMSLEYERPFGESVNIARLLEIYADIGKFIEMNGIEFVKENDEEIDLEMESVLQHRLRPMYNWEVSSGVGVTGGVSSNAGDGDSEEMILERMHL